MQRNTPSMLPQQLWESDKRTGRVKSLKDSVAEYNVAKVFPDWTKL